MPPKHFRVFIHLQVGPRKNFATAWAANAASICASVGLAKVTRLEASRRFGLKASQPLSHDELSAFAALVHDRMTEEVLFLGSKNDTCIGLCLIVQWNPRGPIVLFRHLPLQVYPEPLDSFASDVVPGPVFTVPVVEQGRAALEAIDKVRRYRHKPSGFGQETSAGLGPTQYLTKNIGWHSST